MNLLVLEKVVVLAKTLATLCALVGLLTRVGSLVLDEV